MRKSKTTNVVFYIAVLLVLALAVGLIVRFTDVKDKVTNIVNPTFHIEYDGKAYDGENNTVTFPIGGQAKFKVKGADSYKIRVTPNVTADTDFTYEIDGEVYKFGETDLTSYFVTDESIKDGCFIIDCTQDLSIASVLSKVHDGKTVKLNGEVDFPYLLTFTANDVSISFALRNKYNVTLSETNIVL